jgi:tRNA A58 N-methylase Trm61
MNWTTTHKFKDDLLDYFGDEFKNKNCLEVGTFQGHTTRILSFLFNKVITIDINQEWVDLARNLNEDRNNIEYYIGDIYDWIVPGVTSLYYDTFKDEEVDVVFIDAIHKYHQVVFDTINSIKTFGNIHLVYDDYGLLDEVKAAVDDMINTGMIEVVQYIGGQKDELVNPTSVNKYLKDREGVICKTRIKNG